ncbi:MAG: hypothetical protein JXR83_01935, partial [Deltaproteobacteria bacterium]|nr:hypothetical protein [Deltaproteobacteria bacterium]
MLKRTTIAGCGIALLIVGSLTVRAATKESLPSADELKKLHAQFAPVELKVDLGKLPAGEKEAIKKMIAAAKLMDALFLRQVWAGNPALLVDLMRDTSPVGQARLACFMLFKGPWDRLNHNRPFVPGVGPKPPQANFYPAGSSKADIETWMNKLAAGERAKATSFFTTVRRGAGKTILTVPYSVEYQGELAEAARLLREAAAATQQPTLKAFLEKRADSFIHNEYYDSDVAWMELDSSIEPTIGPYEVYEDEWFNYKAAFEAFISLRDDAETKKLKKFGDSLQELENNLPIDPKWRNSQLGEMAPIRVVNEVYAAGDADAGVKTAAFNLPNDEQILAEKGSKRVMLKNVQEAKFQKVLLPIAKVALSSKDQKKVSFDAFFTHILMHELMHGLGPHETKTSAKQTTVREALKDAYSAIEEAKADVSGLWAMNYLAGKGVVDEKTRKSMFQTYLASMFRSLRFGITESHAKGVA